MPNDRDRAPGQDVEDDRNLRREQLLGLLLRAPRLGPVSLVAVDELHSPLGPPIVVVGATDVIGIVL